MKSFLIDPFERTISEVEYDGNFHSIYKLIDCQTFDVVRLNDKINVYVDDEGLINGPTAFFQHSSYPHPLAGKALVLSVDAEGETVAANTTLEELECDVSFVMPLKINGQILWIKE